MSDQEKKKNNLILVDFKKAKEEKEKIPEFLLEKIELLLVKAKEGKLRTAIIHFDFIPDDDEEHDEDNPTIIGGTLLWNHVHNGLELLGLIETIKALALDNVLGGE